MNSLDTYFQSIAKECEPSNLYNPIHYILSQDGKRIRPKLVGLGAELYGIKPDEVRHVAAAFEMLHNFTLIHDDIMDQAPLRRGLPTVYKKWNSNIAILSGDALAIMALQELLKAPCDDATKIRISDLFARTSLEICEGQQYDLDFETMEHVSIDDYIKMIRLKTAVMLAGCLQSGAIFAKASDADQQALYDFGINIGIAFQLKDDILDLYSDTQVFGKIKGGDIKENKKTYLYLTALQDADEKQRESLLRYFSSTAFDFEIKLQAVKNIYEDLQVKEKTEKSIDQYVKSALDCLQTVSVAEEKKQQLRDLANALVKRDK
ncbi:MAG: polyprenyl synthetase family protein [Bacteroidales bacterium]|nr:polyprenyl synthetase family protein [Bacteroidales bacterium]MBR6063326.1 polyprenyl synthetase family protein [Bacteroidales bacterium]